MKYRMTHLVAIEGKKFRGRTLDVGKELNWECFCRICPDSRLTCGAGDR